MNRKTFGDPWDRPRGGLANRLRWRLAYILNRRSRRLCWAELVTWAQGSTRLRDTVTGGQCRRESLTNEGHGCWCGKFCDGRVMGYPAPLRPLRHEEGRR